MNRIKSKTTIAFLLIISVLIIGTSGYHFISEYDWFDALYMTVITFSTVGFGEVKPLDLQSRLFTIFLILLNIMVYAYTISIFSEYLISAPILKNIIKKRMDKLIHKFHSHTIIVGFGRNGKQAFEKLKTYNRNVIIIEKENNEDFVDNNKDFAYVLGDATQDDILIKAGVERAEAVITTLSADADNLYVILTAKQLNPGIHIISRASNENAAKKLKIAGAHNVIIPHKIGGDFMASLLVTPSLVEFIQQLSVEDRTKRTNLEEISFDDCPVEYHDKSIASLDLRKLTGCTIVGYKDESGQYLVNPDPDTVLVKGSTLIILGQPDQIHRLNDLFNIR
ncbi:MAG: potassium channel protein [Saprospiraceae bacterium]|nr:potassium channel protein [Saprospiraceae bacterium]